MYNLARSKKKWRDIYRFSATAPVLPPFLHSSILKKLPCQISEFYPCFMVLKNGKYAKKNVPQAKFRLCLFSSDVNVKLKLKINIRFNGFLQIFWKISFVNNDFKKRKFKLRKLSNIQAATPLETSIGTWSWSVRGWIRPFLISLGMGLPTCTPLPQIS